MSIKSIINLAKININAAINKIKPEPRISMMMISPNGIKMLEEFEGLRFEAYLDTKQIWTIGYGHTGPDVHKGLVWTQKQAEEAFEHDLMTAEQAITDLTKVRLTQNQFDALTSFVYNVGIHAFANSTCLNKLNKGLFTDSANEMLRWWHAAGSEEGLKKRRKIEHDRFLLP